MKCLGRGPTLDAVDAFDILALFEDSCLRGSTIVGFFYVPLVAPMEADINFSLVGTSERGDELALDIPYLVVKNLFLGTSSTLFFLLSFKRGRPFVSWLAISLLTFSFWFVTSAAAIDEDFNPFLPVVKVAARMVAMSEVGYLLLLKFSTKGQRNVKNYANQ